MADTLPARQAYRNRLAGLLPEHDRLICLDTDTGLFTGVDFGTAAARYVNIGIAEHNLMGMAAGLAASGWTPFVNTMAAFATSRAVEAIKIDIAYNAMPVRIMATHGGLSAGHLGPTHQCLEDLAVMRALPNMTVVVPADAAATEALVDAAIELPGPLYARLGRKATPALPAGVEPPVIGTAQRLRAGGEVLLVATGPYPVLAALDAATALAGQGIEAGVLNMHTIKPFDEAGLIDAAAGTRLVVTVEEHWRSGGLGAAVTETLSEHAPVRIARIGMPDTFAGHVGSQEDLLDHYGITADAVVQTVLRHTSTGKRTQP
ncbi:transketolase C-terminal domain-containing protein [Paractinoplanes ferrugineus]|uniref:Transketolase n=1 Tax=Paractinoplanes ferrugineus TaxID=113564 RepID=A0A919J229_9ACTN|nr:transketolase C-terminal domain-containing protein [Actinoplanes ferrugineus]GIE13346.1 transketolase [Actinoplanes ferrugineus]